MCGSLRFPQELASGLALRVGTPCPFTECMNESLGGLTQGSKPLILGEDQCLHSCGLGHFLGPCPPAILGVWMLPCSPLNMVIPGAGTPPGAKDREVLGALHRLWN